jgi:hypothetical protein
LVILETSSSVVAVAAMRPDKHLHKLVKVNWRISASVAGCSLDIVRRNFVGNCALRDRSASDNDFDKPGVPNYGFGERRRCASRTTFREDLGDA